MPTDIYSEFRKRHPDHQDWSDDDIYKNLVDPTKFKRAFPDHQDWSDADILRNVQQFAPKGFAEKHPVLEAIAGPLDFLSRPFQWQPIKAAEELAGAFKPAPPAPLQETLTKTIPEKLTQAVKGAGGLVFPPLLAAGVVAAPQVTIPAIAGIELARRSIKKGIEAITPNPPLTPALTELASETVPLIAAPIVGGTVGRSLAARKSGWELFYRKQGMEPQRAAAAAELSAQKGQTPPVVMGLPAAPQATPAPAQPVTPPQPLTPTQPTPLPQERLPTELPAQQAQVLREAAQRVEQASGISVVPRLQDLKPITQEFLGSPSVQWSKVSPAAGKIAHATIRVTQTLARDTAGAIEEFHAAWRSLPSKEAETVISLLDNPAVTPATLPPNLSQPQVHAYNWTRNYLTDQLVKINKAREIVGENPITGFQEGYFPHVFRGDWTVTKYDAATKKWTPIDSPKIGWLKESQAEALQAAKQYLMERPGTRLKVELKQWHVDPVEATALSRPAFFRLINRLKSENVAEIDPLSGEVVIGPRGREGAGASLKGVARIKQPFDPAFGHIKPRESNLPGWMQSPEGLEMMIRGGERYAQMLPLRHEVARLREQVQAEAPQSTRLQGQVDSYIDTAVLGKPDAFTRSFNAAWKWRGNDLAWLCALARYNDWRALPTHSKHS